MRSIPMGDDNAQVQLANPARFNPMGAPRHIYYALCSTCDPSVSYYETPALPDQGPMFQGYCVCGALLTFRKLREPIA